MQERSRLGRHHAKLSPKTRAMIMIAALGVVCLIAGFWAEKLALRSSLISHRAATAETLSGLRAAMENRLNSDVNLIRGLVSYIRRVPDIDQATFADVAADLISDDDGCIKELALARNLVVSHVYPVKGNEKALGLDYRTTPTQWPMIKKAIDDKKIVIAGPLKLVQGGTGIIARFPVFLRGRNGAQPKLWGVISSVVDFDEYLMAVNMSAFAKTYDLILRGSDGTGESGPVFWRNTDTDITDPVKLKVDIGSGNWVIEAAPKAGWPRMSDRLPLIVLFPGLVFIMGSIVIVGYMRYNRDLSRAADLMRQARDEAERANAAKSEFLASMSHELRTPLNAINGFSDMLIHEVMGPIGNERYREYARHINLSGDHLLSIVNDILDLSKIEAGEMDLHPAMFELEPVIRESARLTGHRGDGHAGGISIDLSAEAREVHADVRAFKQIMVNLISNAGKYSSEDGRIVVSSVLDESGNTIVRITDDGIGIPEEDIDRVLEPFGQSRRDVAVAHEGTGLGLSLSRKLMVLHGGHLSVESTVGVGTTVTLSFPPPPV